MTLLRRLAGVVADHALAAAAVTATSVALATGGSKGAARLARDASTTPSVGTGNPSLGTPSVGAGTGHADGWRCCRAVSRAAALAPWRVRCLPAALALHRLLAWRGSASAVRLGVRMDGDTVVAHAWVEWDGVVLDPLSPDEPYEVLPLGDAPRAAHEAGGQA